MMRYEMRFRDVLDILHRRRGGIVRVFAVCTALGLVASFGMRPVYRASALITSDKTPPVVVLDQPGYAGPGGPPPVGVDGLDVPTLVALVKSDATRTRARKILARTLGPRRADDALKGLRAQPLWDTQLVRVSVEHANRQVAAAAANAVAAALIDVDARSRRQWATGLRRSIQRQLADSDPKLRAAEDALVAFRSQHGQVPLSGQTDQTTNELAQMEAQRVEVGLQQQEVRARIDAARSRLAQQARISPTEWRPSPLISTLQTQLATEEIELSGLQRQFTPKHPALLNVEAKIEETKRRLDAELANSLEIDQYGVDPTYQQLMQQLRQDEVASAAFTARDQALQASIAEAEGRIESLPAAEVAQARLARDAKEAEEIHQILTEKLQQAMVAESSIGSVVRIVDGAVPPHGPVRSRWLGLLFGAVLGGLFGLGGALVREHVSNPIKSVDHAQRLVSAPVLGAVPRLGGARGRLGNDGTAAPPPVTSSRWSFLPGRGRPAARMRLAGQWRAAFAESFKYLGANVHAAETTQRGRDGRAARTLLVTSPGVGEGTAMVAANLAVALAQGGQRVMLVECDMRRPELARAWALRDCEHEASEGLANVLAGDRQEHEVLHRTAVRNLWFLPAGKLPGYASDLLGSQRMREFLTQDRAHADVVVLAGAPLLPVPDATVLAGVVDGTLLVLAIGTTPCEAAAKACAQLATAGACLLGTVVTGVPTGGIGAYSNYYAGYYDDDPGTAWYVRPAVTRVAVPPRAHAEVAPVPSAPRATGA